MRFLLCIYIIAIWFIIFMSKQDNFFFKFYMFYVIFLVLLLLYRNNDRKLIGVLFSFVNRSC